MQALTGNGSPLQLAVLQLDQPWQRSRGWQRTPKTGNYDQPVPATASADPRVLMFGRFVDRALREARSRGLTTKQIEKATGVPTSTVYRWKRAEIDNPQRDLVMKFCEGLDIPIRTAAQILGWDGSGVSEPEPITDPDMRAVERRLKDPNVSPAEKTTIREMLRFLARGGRD